MRSSLTLLKSIQADTGEAAAVQTSMGIKPSSTPAVTPNPVEEKFPAWPRAEILAALEKGSSSYALALSLQALGTLAKDQAFTDEAAKLTKPTDPGEAWKRAYKTYARYVQPIREAGQKQDVDAACELFGGAAQEVGEIYSSVNPGDPMAETLAVAVYEALSRCYDSHRPQPT